MTVYKLDSFAVSMVVRCRTCQQIQVLRHQRGKQNELCRASITLPLAFASGITKSYIKLPVFAIDCRPTKNAGNNHEAMVFLQSDLTFAQLIPKADLEAAAQLRRVLPTPAMNDSGKCLTDVSELFSAFKPERLLCFTRLQQVSSHSWEAKALRKVAAI